jgi:glycosyltransferase involved in cell wall biosynthesis
VTDARSTVHFVYPFGNRVSCPDSIGREVTLRLRRVYEVKNYDWAELRRIRPGPRDVLLGHACPIPFTVFRRSCVQAGWQRRILMSPFCPGELYQPAYNDAIIRHCDLYLAICGRFWFARAEASEFSHWVPKMRHIDLAVNRDHFPPIKQRFGPPGGRRFVYIGGDSWYKNVRYLSEIARRAPGIPIHWMGNGKPIPGVRSLGYRDFAQPEARRELESYDFMITVGSADANPTTVLEAMAWGLIPVCTPQSGYEGHKGIINVPLNAAQDAAAILRALDQASEEHLLTLQRANWNALASYFNWDRFSDQVMQAIESGESPRCSEEPLSLKVRLRLAELRFPFWRDLCDLRKLPRRLARSHAAGQGG